MAITLEGKFFEKITEEVWGKWGSVLLVFVISTVLGVSICTSVSGQFSYSVTESNVSYSRITNVGIAIIVTVIVCLLTINIWNLVFVFLRNHIRKAKKGKAGILIHIDAESKDVYNDSVRKFGKEFQKNVFDGFDVIFVPYGKKIVDSRKKREIASFLAKKACLLLLTIGINTDRDADSVTYDMGLNATIIHLKYKDQVEREFQKVFSYAMSKYRNTVFESREMIKKLRVTAEELSLACEYVIGLSLYLNGDFRASEIVLSSLSTRIPQGEVWAKMLIAIRRMRYEMFMYISQVYLEKYNRQCTDDEALETMNTYLDKANECIANTATFCLNKAYYCVARNGDTKAAAQYINMCKQADSKNMTWKYSEAFLKAYENKSVGSIVSSYKNALKVSYNHQDLIVFIDTILQKDSTRIGLCLALGILYHEIGDTELSAHYYNQYLSFVDDESKIRGIFTKKGMM